MHKTAQQHCGTCALQLHVKIFKQLFETVPILNGNTKPGIKNIKASVLYF